MSLLILISLLLVFGGLVVSGAAQMRRPAAPFTRLPFFLPLPAIGAVLCLLELGIGRGAALPLPIGFAGGSGGIELDLLSSLFLLLAFLIAWFVEVALPMPRGERGLLRLCLSGALLTMLAGDAFLLAIGGVAAILGIGRTIGGSAGGAPGGVRMPLVAGSGLIGACTLLGSVATPSAALLADTGFSLLRGVGAAGHPGSGMLLPPLALAATLPLLGVWPCRNWQRRLSAAAPVWTPMLATLLGLFLMMRLLLDLAGPAPHGWGVVLVLLGLAGAAEAGITGLRGTRLRPTIVRLLSAQTAMVMIGIGVCLLARADDLPVLAGAALDSTLLLVPMQVLAGLTLLALGQAMETEAGAGALGRLGGLAHSMPIASLLAGLAVAVLGFLPPVGSFVGLWLLLQTVLAASRPGGWLCGLMLIVTLGMVLSAGLSLLGWLRIISVVVLGRPRTPRGAAALDISPGLARASGALLVAPVLIGLLPGLWLDALAPLRQLLGLKADPAPSVFGLVTPGGASLFPLPMVLLGVLALGLIGRVRRAMPGRPVRYAPAWEGGAPPPPPWLPFGDPAAQVGAAALPRALVGILGAPSTGWAGRAVGTSRILRRSITAARAGSLGLSRLLQRQGGLLILVLLGIALLVADWWRPS